MNKKIIRNAAQCNLCKTIIESTHVHDFRSCECVEIFIDCGLDYFRAGAKSFDNFIDLSEYEEVNE